MKTVGDFIKDQFKSSGPLVLAITSAFDYVSGYIKKVVSGSLADTFTSLGPAFSRIADGLKQSSEAGAKQAELALQRIPVAAELAADKASESMGDIPANFKKNMADVPPLFDKVTKKQDEVVNKTQEIIDADKEWEAQTMDRINKDVDASQKAFKEKRANQQTLAKDQTAEDERAANAEKARQEKMKESAALKRAEVNAQIDINNAIAAGDTKLAESLTNAKKLEATIQDLVKSGMGKGEATALANEMGRAAREAERVKNSLATKIDTQIEEKQKSEAIDPSGKLQKKAQEQIAAGQYKAAAATGRQLADRELDTQLRGTGADRDRRSPSDMIKDYYGEKAPTGLTDKEQKELIRQAREEGQYKDTSKMTDTSKKGLDRFADLVPDEKKQEALDKAKKGMEKGVPEAQKDMTSKTGAEDSGAKGEGGKDSNSVMESIKTAVEAIKAAVEKIEPKLPTAALSA